MKNTYIYIKEILFIFMSMLAPVILWLLYSLTKLLIFNGDIDRAIYIFGEIAEGFIITSFILVAPAAFLFWLLLKPFYEKKVIMGKNKILLTVVSAITIIAALFLFNFTNIPELFVLVTIPIGVFVFLRLRKVFRYN